ncbi:MAG: hypothetical protein JXR23_07025, partial [Pontiellaceae bacterium]|nr:hypothetical protein [Pontiellaceae bacterium]
MYDLLKWFPLGSKKPDAIWVMRLKIAYFSGNYPTPNQSAKASCSLRRRGKTPYTLSFFSPPAAPEN